jgi:hypothetical protein
MTPAEAFKIGFLRQCAREGLSPTQLQSRIKTANAMVKQSAGSALQALGNLFSSAKWSTLVAPPVIGALGGYALARANNDDFDPDEAKRQEELAEYYRATDMLRQNKALRSPSM